MAKIKHSNSIIYSSVWTDLHSIGRVTPIQEFFITYQKYFYFQYHRHSGQSKIFQTSLSPYYRSPTKIIEFEQVQFPASISSEDGVSGEFLKIDSNGMFSKK